MTFWNHFFMAMAAFAALAAALWFLVQVMTWVSSFLGMGVTVAVYLAFWAVVFGES